MVFWNKADGIDSMNRLPSLRVRPMKSRLLQGFPPWFVSFSYSFIHSFIHSHLKVLDEVGILFESWVCSVWRGQK